MQTKTNLGAISSSLYVSFQIIANILSAKIAIIPFLNLSVDGGTIIYPLTFTLRDFVHKTLGKKISRHIVILAALANLLLALLLVLIGKLPPDPTWPLQEAYQSILLPVFRITAASLVAQAVSELVDTEIFSWAYKKFTDVKAVFLSNSAALTIDSILFGFIAFWGRLPVATVGQIVLANIIIKSTMSLLTLPGIKAVPRTVQLEEI